MVRVQPEEPHLQAFQSITGTCTDHGSIREQPEGRSRKNLRIPRDSSGFAPSSGKQLRRCPFLALCMHHDDPW